MTPRRLIPRCLSPALLLGGLLAGAPAAQAQTSRLQFSSDPAKLVNPRPDLFVRPNTAETVYLFVRNDADDPRQLTVRLESLDGSTPPVQASLEVPRGQYARVRLPKLPPPPKEAAPPPSPAPAAAPGAPAAKQPPPPPPPPPGFELPVGPKGFAFRLTLIDEDDKGRVLESRPVYVTVRQPETYIDPENLLYTRTDTVRQLELELTADKDLFSGPPAPVEMTFPPQPTLDVKRLRGGVYRRTLTRPGESVRLQANDLPVDDSGEGNGRVEITADGVKRAFIYTPNFRALAKAAPSPRVRDAAVRLYPADKDELPPRLVARPAEAFAVRVEADNGAPEDSVQVRIDRDGDREFRQADEIVSRPGARQQQVWIDPSAGPGQGLLVTTVVKDWVIPLDTRDLRGRVELQAALLGAGGTERALFSTTLVLDDTPPEDALIVSLPDKAVKGRPIRATAAATDPETEIARAFFFLGRPAPDGAVPPNVPTIEAQRSQADPGQWVADIPLPPDVREMDLSVVFVNEVGLTTPETKRIILVDPPPPAGSIKGVVKVGERLQPGVTVTLVSADNKELKQTKTDPKGVFEFKDLAPGPYQVVSAKENSVAILRGATPVTVEVGKTVEVTVTLERRPGR